MLNENALWYLTIDSVSGRIVKRDKFLGAALKLGAMIVTGAATVYATFFYIVPAVQYFLNK